MAHEANHRERLWSEEREAALAAQPFECEECGAEMSEPSDDWPLSLCAPCQASQREFAAYD